MLIFFRLPSEPPGALFQALCPRRFILLINLCRIHFPIIVTITRIVTMKFHSNKISIILFLFLSSIFSTSVLAASQNIYLLRHAEKQADGTKDPSLTEAGIERANNLVALLEDKNITSIYSTKYKRTLETATPLAKSLKIDVQQYYPSKLQEFAEQIKNVAGNIVIVGHSNTTPSLTHLISGKATTAIDESEYDRLYQIIVNPDSTILNKLKLSPLQEHTKLGTLKIDPSKFFTGKLTFEMRFQSEKKSS
jgi:phosphohistidine phosphatase SixA